MIYVDKNIELGDWEVEISAIRAQGPGGQNVNKVSSAIQLRFDIRRSSLPAYYKYKLLQLSDSRISKNGVLTIKAQTYRTQTQNKEDTIARLVALIKTAGVRTKKRKPTKPSAGANKRRLEKKVQRGKVKAMRAKVSVKD